jgi:anti-sigma B factor antagonist
MEVSMHEPLQLDVHHDDGAAIVIAAGEIDLAVAPCLRRCLESLTGTVVLDLTEVTFLDSTGIGVLVGQQNRLAPEGGHLLLRQPNATIRRTIEIVGLDGWITH